MSPGVGRVRPTRPDGPTDAMFPMDDPLHSPLHTPLQIIDLSVRVAGSGPAGSRYRPLAIGPAWLERSGVTGPWLVRLAANGWLRPAAEPRGPSLAAWALLCPEDLVAEHRPVRWTNHRTARRQAAPWLPERSSHPVFPPRRGSIEIHGWCLMYQPPGQVGKERLLTSSAQPGERVAVIDGSPTCPHLPAVFELPGELFDRLEYLAARGIPARPLALPTSAGSDAW
jgi:hypothetical protein